MFMELLIKNSFHRAKQERLQTHIATFDAFSTGKKEENSKR